MVTITARSGLTDSQKFALGRLGTSGVYWIAEALRKYPELRQANEHEHPSPWVRGIVAEASRRQSRGHVGYSRKKGRGNWGTQPIQRNKKRDDWNYQTVSDFVQAFTSKPTDFTQSNVGLAAIQVESLLSERFPHLSTKLVEIELDKENNAFYVVIRGKLSKEELSSLMSEIGHVAEAEPVIRQGDVSGDRVWRSDVTIIKGTPHKNQSKNAPEYDNASRAESRDDAGVIETEDYRRIYRSGGLSEENFRFLFNLSSSPSAIVDENGVLWTLSDGKYFPDTRFIHDGRDEISVEEAIYDRTFWIAGHEYALDDLIEQGFLSDLDEKLRANPSQDIRSAVQEVLSERFGEHGVDDATLDELTTSTMIPQIAPSFLGQQQIKGRPAQQPYAYSSEQERKSLRRKLERTPGRKRIERDKPFGFSEVEADQEKDKDGDGQDQDADGDDGEEEPEGDEKKPPKNGDNQQGQQPQKKETPAEKAQRFIKSIRDPNYHKYAKAWYKYVAGKSNQRPNAEDYEVPELDAQMLRAELGHLGFSEHGISVTPTEPDGDGEGGGEESIEEVVDTTERAGLEQWWNPERERKGGHHHPHGHGNRAKPHQKLVSLSKPMGRGSIVRDSVGDPVGFVEDEYERGDRVECMVTLYDESADLSHLEERGKRPFEERPRASQKKRPRPETDYESVDRAESEIEECLSSFTKPKKREFAESYARYLIEGDEEAPRTTDYGLGGMAGESAKSKVESKIGEIGMIEKYGSTSDMLDLIDNETISEASLSRVLRQVKSGEGYAVLSARRGERSTEENRKARKELADYLQSLGYGYRRVVGTYPETDPETGKKTGRQEGEPSFFIPNIDFEAAQALAHEAGRRWDQENILWGREGEGVWFVYPDGSTEWLGSSLNPRTFHEFFSQIAKGTEWKRADRGELPHHQKRRFAAEDLRIEYAPDHATAAMGWHQQVAQIYEQLRKDVDQHIRSVVGRTANEQEEDVPLRMIDFGYGYWISPDGDLIEVETRGHARKAKELAPKYGIDVPDKGDEDDFRGPFVRNGWVRVVSEGRRLTAQAAYFTRAARRVLEAMAEIFLNAQGGEVMVESLTAGDVVFGRSGQMDPSEFRKKLSALARKSKVPGEKGLAASIGDGDPQVVG